MWHRNKLVVWHSTNCENLSPLTFLGFSFCCIYHQKAFYTSVLLLLKRGGHGRVIGCHRWQVALGDDHTVAVSACETHTGHAASSDGIYTRGEENPLLTNPRGAKCNHFLSHGLDMKWSVLNLAQMLLVFVFLNPAQNTNCWLILLCHKNTCKNPQSLYHHYF